MEIKNKQSVIALLKEKGYSDAAIAGIIGNIDVETGGTFDYQQKQKKGAGYGLFQFDFLKKHYNKWLQDNNLKDSPQSQVDFFHDTVYGKSQDIIGRTTARKVQAALQQEDPQQIATDLSDMWLRPGKPHIERRQRAALSAFDSVKGEVPAPTPKPVAKRPPQESLDALINQEYNNAVYPVKDIYRQEGFQLANPLLYPGYEPWERQLY